MLYNACDTGNARDHAAKVRERVNGEMRATAGKPARGPAANPRRDAPVTGR